MDEERAPWKHRVSDFRRDHILIDHSSLLTAFQKEFLKPHRLLQIGTLDFVSFDPLIEYVNIRDWKIDFVEPQPHYADLLRSRYSQFPNVKVHEFCVADTPGSRTFYFIDPAAVANKLVPEWAAGIASLHLDRNALGGFGCSVKEYEAIRGHICSIAVECLDIKTFLSSFAAEPPTIIWVDIEGEDLSVVKALDLDADKPAIIRVEAINMNDDSLDFSFDKFSKSGYAVGIFDNDLFAIRRDLL